MRLWRRAGGLPGVGIALATLVALRAFQLLLVAALIQPGDDFLGRLLLWDAGWFISVAIEGYPDGYTYDRSGTMLGNGFAFFPLFPLLVRAVTVLGLSAADASLLVAGVSGLVAGIVVYLLGVALWSRRTGYLLMVLVCAQPMSVVFAMGYTEPLFLALAAGALLAAHQRIWWLAGILGVAAALTRPVGLAVAVALVVAVVLLWRQSRVGTPTLVPIPENGSGGLLGLAAARTGPGASARGVLGAPARGELGSARLRLADKGAVSRPELVRAGLAAAATVLAGPIFLAWVGFRVGQWDAWFKVQTAGWGSTFDFGRGVAEFVIDVLTGRGAGLEMITAWMIIGVLLLCLLTVAQRVWPPLLAFGLVAFVMAIGQAGYWHSKPRLLVMVMLLAAVPLAQALDRAATRTAITVVALWSGFGLWFGAYMITIWPFTI